LAGLKPLAFSLVPPPGLFPYSIFYISCHCHRGRDHFVRLAFHLHFSVKMDSIRQSTDGVHLIDKIRKS
jgi:hypothetical protein